LSRRTAVHLVRHGAVHNPQGIHYGRLPGYRLSEEGARQAAAAAAALKDQPLSAIYSSPLERAMQTAQAIAGWHPGLAVVRSDLLLDVCIPYEGWTFHDIQARQWDIFSGNRPPHETANDVLSRGLRFLRLARREHPQAEVVAVTHGDVIALLMLWARGTPFEPEDRLPLYSHYLATGSITTLSFETQEPDECPKLTYLSPE
jgi:broad specificity phosphatase PhoE